MKNEFIDSIKKDVSLLIGVFRDTFLGLKDVNLLKSMGIWGLTSIVILLLGGLWFPFTYLFLVPSYFFALQLTGADLIKVKRRGAYGLLLYFVLYLVMFGLMSFMNSENDLVSSFFALISMFIMLLLPLFPIYIGKAGSGPIRALVQSLRFVISAPFKTMFMNYGWFFILAITAYLGVLGFFLLTFGIYVFIYSMNLYWKRVRKGSEKG